MWRLYKPKGDFRQDLQDDTADEISQVVRLLDFASSGGYSRSDWRSMQQEIRAIPDGEIERTAKEVLASGRRRDIPPVLDELCFVWSQKDPEAALAFAGSIPDKSLGKICYSVAFKGWAEDDWKSAKAWLDKLPANKLRDRLATELIEKVAVHDPLAALQLLSDEFAQGKRPDTYQGPHRQRPRTPARALRQNTGRGGKRQVTHLLENRHSGTPARPCLPACTRELIQNILMSDAPPEATCEPTMT